MHLFFKISLIFALFFIKPSMFTAQSIFYSDIFNGGVTGDGFILLTSSDTCFFNLNLNNSTFIRKAYLFCENRNNSIARNLNFNGTIFYTDEIYHSGTVISFDYSGLSEVQITSMVIDVTNLIDIYSNSYYLIPPENQTSSTQDGQISGYYLLVLYENSLLPPLDVKIIQNIQNASPQYYFNFSDLNPINLNHPISLAVRTTDICNNITDGSIVKINGTNIGTIGGSEPQVSFYCSGVAGSFNHENGVLLGLSNDTPDNFMNGSDGLANIQPYLNNSTSFNLSFSYQTPNSINERTNQVLNLFLAYTTPCQPFPVNVSPDTTICRNSPPLQLSASGGTQYLWQPATDLSCTTCPNPVFTGDSSRFYTVRIWNNDSCSVVRPVKVNVKPLPSFSSMQVSPSSCGGNTGYIVSNSTLLGESYSINGGALQQTGSFPSLSSGTYTVTLHELNGCTRDSVVTVGTNITVDALFTATPHSGGAPLTVYFNNQSTNASAYEWFLNNQSQGNSFSNFTFDTTGIYTVTLVAWQNDPSCADTFSIQIHVYDSLIVQVPNVFTPNNDGKNDIFGIQANIPVSIDYQILNRWGNVMISGKEVVSVPTTSGNQFTILWDGSDATEGTYFYKIEVTALSNGKKEMLDGFMELVR